MNPLKLKLLDELMEHLSGSQGRDLKSLFDESKKPMEKEIPEMGEGKPKGIALEKVSIMGKPKGANPIAGKEEAFDDKAKDAIDGISKKPDEMSDKMPGEEEMSNDELEELLSKYLK